jgi:hypothetical protein
MRKYKADESQPVNPVYFRTCIILLLFIPGLLAVIMRSRFLVVLFVLSCSFCLGQNFDVYQTLLPQGPVPKDFTEQTSLKVANEITNVTDKSARQRKMKKKFVLESTFSIDDFLASGNVLFNDEVSFYLDEVLKEVLKPYPDLNKKVRVYAVKSAAVNAFTTNDGLIFVNLGLLARLENEAQLAFVLSHEIVHYQKKHVINAYVNSIEIEQGRRDYRKLKVSDKGFSKSTYNKELETEADLEAIGIYLQSEYAKDSIDRIFDVLKFADSPLSWRSFQKNIFESGRYIFPDSVILDHVKSSVINEDYDDSESSHPNIKKRREGVLAKIKNQKGGRKYKISLSRFNLIRKISRYELCRQFLLDHRYAEALTLAISLQQENPKSSYLRESVAKACYGMALLSLRGKLQFDKGKWTGENERIMRFLEKQSSYELCVLAIRQLYFCAEATPDNKEITFMLQHLISTFSEDNDGAGQHFLRTTRAKPNENLPHAYTQFAFLDFKNTTAFFELFDKSISVKKKDGDKEDKKKKKHERGSLNVNKVVVVNPVYRMVDIRKKQKVRHMQAEEVLVNINDKIYDAASKLNMKTDIINPNTMTSGQASQMQSNSVLNDWISEQMLSDKPSVSPIYNEMLMLAEKHKTNHFMWMGCLTVKGERKGKGFLIIGTAIVPALAPWTVPPFFIAQSKTLYFALVFDVSTQKLELLDLRQMNMKDNKSLLQSNIYYTLFKIKK